MHATPTVSDNHVPLVDSASQNAQSHRHTQNWVGDVSSEYARQRGYLEKTIEGLKRKLAVDADAHRTNELRIMSHNVTLIRELNELRREIKVPSPAVRVHDASCRSCMIAASYKVLQALQGPLMCHCLRHHADAEVSSSTEWAKWDIGCTRHPSCIWPQSQQLVFKP